MYRDKKIAVVVPAYNEEMLIKDTITSVPDYVDKIYAVNDCLLIRLRGN
jgi:glycosyltransferase involved in cell wall biosynthesis